MFQLLVFIYVSLVIIFSTNITTRNHIFTCSNNVWNSTRMQLNININVNTPKNVLLLEIGGKF